MRSAMVAFAIVFTFFLPFVAIAQDQQTKPPQDNPTPAPPASRIRLNANVEAANMIRMVTPVYPPLAKQIHICGTVELHAIIDKEGFIQSLEYVSGHPLLMKAAIDAVKQWQYKPTLLEGKPVEVDTKISVAFTMDKCAASQPSSAPDSQSQPAGNSQTPAQSQSEHPIDPQFRKDLDHLIEVVGLKTSMKSIGQTTFQSFRPMIIDSLPPTVDRERIANAYLEKLIALLQSETFYERVEAAYAKYLSDEDVKAIIQFYESPAGERLIAALPQLSAELLELGRQMATDAMPGIFKELCSQFPELQGKAKFCPQVDQEKKSFLREQRPGIASGSL